MAKEIAFSINILGSEKMVNTIEELEKSLKAANTELKKTQIGSDAFNELSQDVAKSTFELNKLRKEQQEANKAFQASKEAVGSVNALSKELRDLRRQYDALSKADREGEIGKQLSANINKLDKELKGIDFSIGRYFRNIGNYLSALSKGTGNFSKKIGGLAGAATGIANVGFALQGAFAIGQAALTAINYIDQFRKEIDAAADTVVKFGDVTNEELGQVAAETLALSKTFGVSTEEISKAAQQLARETGLTFNDALGKIGEGLINGQEDNQEYLKGIAEFPSKFSAAGKASLEYSDRLREQLETERDLANAQVELSTSLSGFTSGTANLGTKLKTGFLTVLVSILNFFKPFVDTIKNAAVEFGRFFGNFSKGNSTFELFGKLINIALFPFKILLNTTSAAFRAFGSLLGAVNNYIAESPKLQFVLQQVGAAFGVIIDFIAAIPDALNTSLDAIANFARDAASFITAGFIDDSATVAAADAAGRAGKTIAQELVNRYGEELQQLPLQTQQAITAAGIQAATAAFNAGQSIPDALAAGIRAADAAAIAAGLNPVVEQVRNVEKKLTDEQIKAQEERRKKAKDDAKKRIEDQKAFEDERKQQILDASQLLLNLTNQLNNETLGLLSDSTDKQLLLEKQRYKEQQEAQEAATVAFIDKVAEQQEKAATLYGQGSTEFLAIQQQGDEQIQQVQQANFKILEAQEEQHQQNLNNIVKQGAEARKAQELERQKGIQDFAAQSLDIQREADQLNSELQRLAIQKRIDAAKAGSEEEIQLQKELEQLRAQEIRDEIDLLAQKEQLLKDSAALGIEIESNAYEKIAVERAKLNNELAKLEQDSAKKTGQTFSELVQKVTDLASKATSLFTQVADAFDARDLARVENQQQRSNEVIAQLEENLQNASGLQAAYLEQQIEREKVAAEKIAAEKAQIERRAARRRKEIAVIESIINTIVEVTKVLANPLAAIAVGVAGAIQTAAIVAQPLATGGKVKPYKGINGKITVAPNAPRLSNGDSVLAYLSPGEVVLNKKQQAAAGGDGFFRRIGVPAFASGGFVGNATPNISSLERQNNLGQQAAQRIRVELKTSDLERDDENRQQVRVISTF